jgi:hypothetical protein
MDKRELILKKKIAAQKTAAAKKKPAGSMRRRFSGSGAKIMFISKDIKACLEEAGKYKRRGLAFKIAEEYDSLGHKVYQLIIFE